MGKLHKDWRDSRLGHVVQVVGARLVRFGLHIGSGDLVGWRPVVITADMVGTTFAQFCSVDAKTKGYKRLSPDQLMWARAVRAAGGYAGVAMKVEGAPGSIAISEVGGDV